MSIYVDGVCVAIYVVMWKLSFRFTHSNNNTNNDNREKKKWKHKKKTNIKTIKVKHFAWNMRRSEKEWQKQKRQTDIYEHMELASKTNIFSNTYTAKFLLFQKQKRSTKKNYLFGFASALTHCQEKHSTFVGLAWLWSKCNLTISNAI